MSETKLPEKDPLGLPPNFFEQKEMEAERSCSCRRRYWYGTREKRSRKKGRP
jgi:hypothetical protein